MTKGIKRGFFSVLSLYFIKTHRDKSTLTHTHSYVPFLLSGYSTAAGRVSDLCVCVRALFSLMPLAQSVGHSNFAGVNSDLWLHYSWLDWFSPRGWLPAQHYTLQWHSQDHTLPSVPFTYSLHFSLSSPSIHPISTYLTCHTVAPSCSHSSISASHFFSPATLSFFLTNHPWCDFLFSFDTSLLFSHPSLYLIISPLLPLSYHPSVPPLLSSISHLFYNLFYGHNYVDNQTLHLYAIVEQLISKTRNFNMSL